MHMILVRDESRVRTTVGSNRNMGGKRKEKYSKEYLSTYYFLHRDGSIVGRGVVRDSYQVVVRHVMCGSDIGVPVLLSWMSKPKEVSLLA